jgi:hypothetical protein
VRLPDETKRLAIVGATGSGKTQAALWHLSMRDIDRRPWIVYNFKDDRSIDSIPQKRDIEIDELPLKPGVYVTHPQPNQTDEVEAQMWAIWEKQGIGVYVDEGYMVGPNNPAFRAMLTQGRSREIPIIVLSQRPVWMDRFVFSESEFFQVFRLNHKRDRKSVEEFVPADLSQRLPDYHSYYYDVGENKVTILKPVPSIQQIHRRFDQRLSAIRKTI